MSFELSSIITGLQKEALSVAHSGKANARRVADALHERCGGSRALDFLGLQLGLVELVEDDLEQLLQIDASHVRGVVGNRLQLRERDAAFSEAFEVLSAVRSAVEGIFGQAARVELFGDVSALPQDPLALHRLGVRIRDQLASEELVLPPVRLPGFPPLERDKLAAGLARPLDRLGRVLATLGLERKDADATLLDKTEGIEEFRRTVRFVAGCLASLYGLAGLDDLAAKIRPKRRAPRRTNGDGPDGPDATGTEPGESDGEAVAADGETVSASSDEDDAAADPAGGEAGSDEPAGPSRSGPIGVVR